MDFITELEEKRKEVVDGLTEIGISDVHATSECISLTIELSPGRSEDKCIGTSKVGGIPDFPRGWEWPKYEAQPMTFLAQINFNEICSHPELTLILEAGILYFFVFFETPGMEFFGDKKSSEISVLYFNGSEDKLSSRDFPESLPEKYKTVETEIFYGYEYAIPFHEEDLYFSKKGLELTEEEINLLAESSLELYKPSSQILGYPSCITSHPVFFWFSEAELNTSESMSSREELVNLLNIDFMVFNLFKEINATKGYWGIKRTDLERLNFDGVALQFQT